jgi:hypothetical protein
MNVSGAGAAAGAPQQNSAQNANLQQALSSIKDLLADIMNTTEEGAFNVGASGQKGKAGGPQATANRNFTEQAGRPDLHATEAAAAAAEAGVVDELDQTKKKKRKEKELQEKLKKLLGYVEGMDLSNLQPEERAEVEEFIKNAKTIAHLSNKLKFLEDKEIYYMGLIEKQKQNRGQ